MKLYTDDELAIQKAKRPIIMNGIPRLAEREDLASRTFAVSLPHFDDGAADRLTESELLDRWQKARPRIFAGLLDGVCSALRNVEGVTLPASPRLVGALKWAKAAEANFGFDDGETFKAYQENARETIQTTFEADVVAIVLTRWQQVHQIHRRIFFEGGENSSLPHTGTAAHLASFGFRVRFAGAGCFGVGGKN